ncbi:MAG: HlyD family efflux transporter periplasmic adaptor subunit [Xanthomonadaceae bacterium]|nr:HlyD family efflux transporter periplasmic adaptor subunit [Xanthomonadaceae bacterium]
MRPSAALHRTFAFALLVTALGGCGRPAAEAPPAAAGRYAAMARGTVDVEGGLLTIYAPRDGHVVAVPVGEGDVVRAGDLLAEIDPAATDLAVATAQAEVAQAQAQLAAQDVRLDPAQRRAARLSAARREGLATEQSADDAEALQQGQRAERDVAAAALLLARQHLKTAQWEREQRSVRAPVDATVARRLVTLGSSVLTQPPGELFVLLPRQPLVVRAEIEQDFVERVHAGMSAEIVDEVAPDKVYAAKVQRLAEVFSRRSGSDAPNERQDVRVLECTLVLKDASLRVGQRVLVRFIAGT